MAELHELLAVEPELAKDAQDALGSILDKFARPDQFLGQSRRYQSWEDEGTKFPPDDKNLPTTIPEELGSLFIKLKAWYDASMQKEVTNQKARADVVIGDEVIFKGLAATALLNLEKKLLDLGKILAQIPVLDTASNWRYDENVAGWVSDERVSYRDEQRFAYEQMAKPTREHQEQIHTIKIMKQVGEWHTTIHSGMIPRSEKMTILQRWRELYLAVREARTRANKAEIADVHSDAIFDYIRG